MTIKMIKKDAQISITVGTPFISQIQGILLSLLADKSEEDISSMKEFIPSVKNEDGEFPEEWMRHVYTITSLLNEIEATAEKTNQVIDKDLDELITESGS
jgi:hypothetical protein